RARDLLAQLGFLEAFSYAMGAEGEDDPFVPADAPPALRLSNPIAEQLSHLRRSLVPGLLRVVDTNRRRGAADVRVFEVGRVFLGVPGGFPDERARVALAWSGSAFPRHWNGPARPV